MIIEMFELKKYGGIFFIIIFNYLFIFRKF